MPFQPKQLLGGGPVVETQPTEGVITPEAASAEAVVAEPATEVVTAETVIAEVTVVAKPEWQVSADGKTADIGPVELGVIYKAPQNDKVTVTFTKLPEKSGNLTIKEIELTPEEQLSLGALSDTAYDITSDMTNGDFTYDLTLPYPDKDNDGKAEILGNSKNEVKADDLQVLYTENEGGNLVKDDMTEMTDQTDANKSKKVIEIKGLNHFTVFVVATVTNPSCSTVDGVIVGGITISGVNDQCYSTIQAAVSAAPSGATIYVAAGTYTEQLTIHKNLVLEGAGIGQTIIKAPEDRTGTAPAFSAGNNFQADYIIAAYPTTVLTNSDTISVKITGFTIDANNKPMVNGGRYPGVFFRKVSNSDIEDAGLFASEVKGFKSADTETSGVWIEDDCQLTIDGNSFNDFTEFGTNVYGYAGYSMPVVTTSDNDYAASSAGNSNGSINYWFTDAGTVSGNTITGGLDGIQIVQASDISISENTISGGTNNGILLDSGSSNITILGNTISDFGYNGIYLYDSSDNSIFKNTISNIHSGDTSSPEASGWAIGIDGSSSDNTVGNGTTAKANVLGSSDLGIYFATNATGNSASGNKIYPNDLYEMYNAGADSVDATNNWWGSSVLATVLSKIVGNVTYKPYYIDSGMTTLSDVKAITTFTIPSQVGFTTINEGAETIALTMPYGTDVSALVPTITITGSSVSPASLVAHDFTAPSTYTVTSIDEATTQDYVVTVTVAENPAKAITSFDFTSPAVTGIVNEGAKTVSLIVPFGTNVTALVPTITITGVSISPPSGVANDFTTPQAYTVTAADTTTQIYTVTVASRILPTLSVTNSPIIYDGSTHTATVIGSVAGVVNNVEYNGSATIPTNASTYAITADFAPTDSINYESLIGASAGDFLITKANQATLTVVAPATLVYGDTLTLTTTGGSGTGAVTYDEGVSNGCSVSGDKLSVIKAEATCSVTATNAGDTNYNPKTSEAVSVKLNRANITSYSVLPYSVPYDGNTHTATGTAKGVNNEDLTLDLSGTTHTDVDNYTIDMWSFNDPNGNYNGLGGSVNDVITKKEITVTANAESKEKGDADPELKYEVSPALAVGDSFTGSLTRDAGESVDIYAIRIGSLDAGTNYNLTYVGANLTISDTTPPTITINNPDATYAQSKTITANGGDGILTQSVTAGDVCDDTLTFAAYSDITFSSDSDNGKKVCYKSEDTANNVTYKLSDAIGGIDTTAPTLPVATPPAGDYMTDQLVTLASSDGGSGLDAIYYTTDGSDPSDTSNFSRSLYSDAITADKDMTIKAVTYDMVGNASGIISAIYGIAPVISSQASVSGESHVTITWHTDDLATSRVVWDVVSHPTLGLAPNYGYANSTVEDSTKVTSHSVYIDGLNDNDTYYYRMISGGSPDRVSDEAKISTDENKDTSAGGNGNGNNNNSVAANLTNTATSGVATNPQGVATGDEQVQGEQTNSENNLSQNQSASGEENKLVAGEETTKGTSIWKNIWTYVIVAFFLMILSWWLIRRKINGNESNIA